MFNEIFGKLSKSFRMFDFLHSDKVSKFSPGRFVGAFSVFSLIWFIRTLIDMLYRILIDVTFVSRSIDAKVISNISMWIKHRQTFEI